MTKEKRDPGLGSITERADGRLWVRGPRSGGRMSLGVFEPNERELAERKLAAHVLALRQVDPRTLHGATLRTCGERHLDEAAADQTPALAALRSRWKHLLAAPFVDDPIEDLGQPAIDAWARGVRRPRGPLAPAYVSAILALLSAICARAVRDGAIAVNPCAGLRLPKARVTEDPWTYLEPAEQRSLLAVELPDGDHYVVAVALGTGLREGELFALRTADVHLDVEHPYAVIRYGGRDKATKAGEVRRIPLFGIALAAVRAWLPLVSLYCKRNPRGLLFPGPHGGMRDVGHPLRRHKRVNGKIVAHDGFDAALERAGILRRVGGELSAAHRHDGQWPRWHDLRHTCATSLVAGWWGASWRLEDVCQLLRHSSISVTEKYAHLAPSVVADLGTRTDGVRVGYGSDGPGVRSAANPARDEPAHAVDPGNPYFHGSQQNDRTTKGNPSSVPHMYPMGGVEPEPEGVAAMRELLRAVGATAVGWDILEDAVVEQEEERMAKDHEDIDRGWWPRDCMVEPDDDDDDLNEALCRIYRMTDRALCEGRFDEVDEALRQIDPAATPLVLLGGWLSSTAAARHCLPYWDALARASRRRVSWVDDYLEQEEG